MNRLIRSLLSGVGAAMILGTLYMIPSNTSRMFLFTISILGLIVMLIGLLYPQSVGQVGEGEAA